MASNTFWTEPHFTGIVLILGSLLFLGGAGLTPRDEQGTFIFSLPQRAQLLLIAKHVRLWKWSASFFISGVVVTLLGLVLLASLFREAGDRFFALPGLIAFGFGAVLWVIHLASRPNIDLWAAQETANTGVIPEFYGPFTRWRGMLFVLYTVLAFSGLAAYGGAVLSTSVLPEWVGWTAIVYALVGMGVLGITRDAPPFLHHLMPLVIGVLLLW